MYAAVVTEFATTVGPSVCEVPDPVPGAHEVLVKVVAAAVNPVDRATQAGALYAAGLHREPPLRLGWDVTGVVVAVGPGVRRLRCDQTVIGLSDRLMAPTKTHGELVVIDEYAATAVPDTSPPVELSTLPLAGLTAWQALAKCKPRPGDTVLVTGASGNVGSLAIQLALLRGCTVLGAGRPSQRAAIEDAGAVFVDAADIPGDVRERYPTGVTAAIDAASLGAASLDAVQRNGHHVSLVVTERPAPLRGITSSSLAVQANWEQLTALAALYLNEQLRLPSAIRTFPLSAVPAAYRDATAGRVVITPSLS